MKKIYNIYCVTSSRADYGLLSPLLKNLNYQQDINLTVVAAGSHGSNNLGSTYFEIKKDKYKNIKKAFVEFKSKNIQDIINNISKTLVFTKRIIKNKIDLLILMGDRYEIFAYALSAHLSNIPIAHFSGGEITEGSTDDAFRHSITKMSYLHFVSNNLHKKRVEQLGENPSRVFNVGEIGLDSIKKIIFINKKSLFKNLKLDLKKKTILITYHPETLNKKNLIKFNIFLKSFFNYNNYNLVFTGANSDFEGDKINIILKKFVKKKKNAFFFQSLGREKYISLMKCSDLVVGNSSSGILEAPSLKVISINVGDRQKGRLSAKSVIHCPCKSVLLKKNISRYISKKIKINNFKNPYEKKNSVNSAIKIIKKFTKKKLKLTKKFYDL